MNKIYQGAIDNQTSEQKAKNYKLAEITASISPVVWVEKTNWNQYPVRDQDGSSTCVCMTYATELGILFKQKYGEFYDFSSSFPYQHRGGDYGGCTSSDIYSVFPRIGNVSEVLMPSQNMSEAEVLNVEMKNWHKDLAKVYKVSRIELPIDFETVASTIQATGKGVMVWFHFSREEWTDTPELLNLPITNGHSVTAVDFLLKNGKKYLVIQDSWGLKFGRDGIRFISEEYFNARCFLASYLKIFQTLDPETVEKPVYNGTIISLQQCLKYEGLFPSNVPEIENYGPLTKKAVIEFQKRYNIKPALGVFGPLTRAKILSIYN